MGRLSIVPLLGKNLDLKNKQLRHSRRNIYNLFNLNNLYEIKSVSESAYSLYVFF
jgi:hypothetical protein